jgi:hypothetical protein
MELEDIRPPGTGAKNLNLELEQITWPETGANKLI